MARFFFMPLGPDALPPGYPGLPGHRSELAKSRFGRSPEGALRLSSRIPCPKSCSAGSLPRGPPPAGAGCGSLREAAGPAWLARGSPGASGFEPAPLLANRVDSGLFIEAASVESSGADRAPVEGLREVDFEIEVFVALVEEAFGLMTLLWSLLPEPSSSLSSR